MDIAVGALLDGAYSLKLHGTDSSVWNLPCLQQSNPCCMGQPGFSNRGCAVSVLILLIFLPYFSCLKNQVFLRTSKFVALPGWIFHRIHGTIWYLSLYLLIYPSKINHSSHGCDGLQPPPLCHQVYTFDKRNKLFFSCEKNWQKTDKIWLFRYFCQLDEVLSCRVLKGGEGVTGEP